MFSFTFVSDYNTDFLMVYFVQLKNMYSYLNSSLKLSYIVRGLSCQLSYCNLLYYTNSSTSFLLFYLINFYFFHLHHVDLIPSDPNDPQGLMSR